MCKLTPSISPTSNPHLKTNLSPSLLPLQTARPAGPLPPLSGAATDPYPFPPFLLVHYGYLKLVQHDIISVCELPEKSKLQNQSCRRSSWDFITSIACLHEYLSFLTDPICHNSCLSGEERKKKKKKKKKNLLNWCTTHVSASWLGKEIRGPCRKTCFLQHCSHFPFDSGYSGFWPVRIVGIILTHNLHSIVAYQIMWTANYKWLFQTYFYLAWWMPFKRYHRLLAYLCGCKANDMWNS